MPGMSTKPGGTQYPATPPCLKMNNSNSGHTADTDASSPNNHTENRPSRRRFLGQVGAALAGGAVLGKLPQAAAQSLNPRTGEGTQSSAAGSRVQQAYQVRVQAATQEAQIPTARHTTNGDENRYFDKSGSYSKGLLQDGIGLVNLNAWASFKTALKSGNFSDFENMVMGGTRTMNSASSTKYSVMYPWRRLIPRS